VLIEKTIPLFFGILLIYTNSKIILNISQNVYLAGVTSFLTVFSVNVLRVLSDLHRNFMALSLSFVAFLWFANLRQAQTHQPFLTKKHLLFILLLLIIASTHFETYFVLAAALFIFELTRRDVKALFKTSLMLAVPVIVLLAIFPDYFFGYLNTVVIFHQNLVLEDLILWIGGSWPLLLFIFLGIPLFLGSQFRQNILAVLTYSWFLVILAIVLLIGPVNREFALRSLYITPTPLLFSLTLIGAKIHLTHLWKRLYPKLGWNSKKTWYATRLPLHYLILTLLIMGVLAGSYLTISEKVDVFLTPFVPKFDHDKIVKAAESLRQDGYVLPIVVFGGHPRDIGLVQLYRNYISVETGEHFGYYGDLLNLFHLVPSQPRIDPSNAPYHSQLEAYYLTLYFDELIGNLTEPIPPMYTHDSYVTNDTLWSFPLLIITPTFYTQEIPDYLTSFHIGEGIYVIPPYSLDPSQIT
jgi:hypothetical protein